MSPLLFVGCPVLSGIVSCNLRPGKTNVSSIEVTTEEEVAAFDRAKIFEKLDYLPQPADYRLPIPWVVQQQVAATNGVHYIDRVGKLTNYPQFELPVAAASGEKLMLDIGCGWGRWLAGGARKGFIPIGIDLRQEFCVTARQTLQNQQLRGYSVVADLKNLPFHANVFDLVWSFSVIQHTHIDRLMSCLAHIQRILHSAGQTKLEFPNSLGVRNRLHLSKAFERQRLDYDSWCVRYYSPEQYQAIFQQIFGNFDYSIHSFLGIGVLKEDLRYVSAKNKAIAFTSLCATAIGKLLPFLKRYADSIYVQAKANKTSSANPAVANFLKRHAADSRDNLNVVELLQCPISSESLVLSEDRKFLSASNARLRYPIVEDIPILVASQAERF